MKVACFLSVCAALVTTATALCGDVSPSAGPNEVDNGTYPTPEVLNWFKYTKGGGYDNYKCVTSNRTEKTVNGKQCQILEIRGKPSEGGNIKTISTLYLYPTANSSLNMWHVAGKDCATYDNKTLHAVIYDTTDGTSIGGQYRSSYTRFFTDDSLTTCSKCVVRIAGRIANPDDTKIGTAVTASNNLGADCGDYYDLPRNDC